MSDEAEDAIHEFFDRTRKVLSGKYSSRYALYVERSAEDLREALRQIECDPSPWWAAETEQWLLELLIQGRSEQLAFDVLASVAATRVLDGSAVPPPLRVFAASVISGKCKRPKKGRGAPKENALRDSVIRAAIEIGLKARPDLPATSRSNSVSVCELVARCLKDHFDVELEYEGVVEIWKNRSRGDKPTPGG